MSAVNSGTKSAVGTRPRQNGRRELTKEEGLAATLMAARGTLAARARQLIALEQELATEKASSLRLETEIEDMKNAALSAEYGFPDRYALKAEGGVLALYPQEGGQ